MNNLPQQARGCLLHRCRCAWHLKYYDATQQNFLNSVIAVDRVFTEVSILLNLIRRYVLDNYYTYGIIATVKKKITITLNTHILVTFTLRRLVHT